MPCGLHGRRCSPTRFSARSSTRSERGSSRSTGTSRCATAGRVERGLCDAEITALADAARAHGPVTVRRYRGLAAVDADVIRDTCVAPATRRVSPVSPADITAMRGFLDDLGPGR